MIIKKNIISFVKNQKRKGKEMAAEKQFENKIKRFLESVGVYPLGTPDDKMRISPVGYYEKRHGSAFTKSGLPDMHVCIYGSSIEVEIKAEKGRVSELQKFMIQQINKSGGNAVVVRPSDFGVFCDMIKDYL